MHLSKLWKVWPKHQGLLPYWRFCIPHVLCEIVNVQSILICKWEMYLTLFDTHLQLFKKKIVKAKTFFGASSSSSFYIIHRPLSFLLWQEEEYHLWTMTFTGFMFLWCNYKCPHWLLCRQDGSSIPWLHILYCVLRITSE